MGCDIAVAGAASKLMPGKGVFLLRIRVRLTETWYQPTVGVPLLIIIASPRPALRRKSVRFWMSGFYLVRIN